MLTSVSRSVLYTPCREVVPDPEEQALLALLEAEYTRHPFHGSHKMTAYLRGLGHRINRTPSLRSTPTCCGFLLRFVLTGGPLLDAPSTENVTAIKKTSIPTKVF